ncbi:hypothetical protein CWE12_00125 [Aliidiomarina sedimenti]|uniref:CBS domain-containing protein n=1 Tax=Aliidiomarina sedimenti TaxID=1933879 RepID=A0ABY0C0V5_9GAMM|nr:hypothetical protein [Aliidiomarina sedimenti]RUO31447.1 hypothetical protein CWE12_00125 [Aliidiomarina sedimenti]
MSHYTSLSWAAMPAQLPLAKLNARTKLSWNEPARMVLDNFSDQDPLHVHTSTKLKHADAIMDGAGARYICVFDHQQRLTGVLALRDLHGRQAVRLAKELSIAHDDLSVDYLMKPISQLPLITYQQLERARIGDVVATLQKSGQDFLLVQEEGQIVGLVSSLNIVERTGESVQVRHHVESFVDILHAIKHSDDIE